MTVFYLDTSVAVRVLFKQSTAAVLWFEDATANHSVVASRLLKTELTRVLRRESLDIALRDRIIDYVGLVHIDNAVLTEADAIVPHVRSLDAIHLASALRSGIDELVIVSHDAQMLAVARQLGFDVHDPVSA